MIWSSRERWPKPRPELLAAYADGELEGPAFRQLKAQVESWLAAHPQAAADLAADRHLEDLLRRCPAPGPSEDLWDAVQGRVRSDLERLAAAGRQGFSLRRRLTAAMAGLTSAAAAVWLALSLVPRPASPELSRATHPARVADQDVAFPVATEDEVEILSVQGEDTGTVVVGQMPLQGPMELAGPGDVTLTSVRPARADNMMPDVRMDDTDTPLVWARLEGEREE
jgi:anti-sigma factor RsiW